MFHEQWHAQVLGVVEVLKASGRIDATDWSETLGAELDRVQSNDDAAYYGAFLAALEELLARDGVAETREVDQREAEWRAAYLRTPHGKPVELG